MPVVNIGSVGVKGVGILGRDIVGHCGLVIDMS